MPRRATPTSSNALREGEVLRTFGVGAQILKDLGVRRMRVLSAPKQMHGISAFGLEVEATSERTSLTGVRACVEGEVTARGRKVAIVAAQLQ